MSFLCIYSRFVVAMPVPIQMHCWSGVQSGQLSHRHATLGRACATARPSQHCRTTLCSQQQLATRWACGQKSRRDSSSLTAAAQSTQQPPSGESDVDHEDLEARSFAVALATVANDVKCHDIKVLHVAPMVSWTSYMVLCTVFSKPQLLAALARVETAANEEWNTSRMNSTGTSPWEVLDFGSVVVHAFTDEQRRHYNLEGFYRDAEAVALPFAQEPAGLRPDAWATTSS